MKRRFQSGSAKRKEKAKRLKNESKGKQTFEQLGWKKLSTTAELETKSRISLSVLDDNGERHKSQEASLELVQEESDSKIPSKNLVEDKNFQMRTTNHNVETESSLLMAASSANRHFSSSIEEHLSSLVEEHTSSY